LQFYSWIEKKHEDENKNQHRIVNKKKHTKNTNRKLNTKTHTQKHENTLIISIETQWVYCVSRSLATENPKSRARARCRNYVIFDQNYDFDNFHTKKNEKMHKYINKSVNQ